MKQETLERLQSSGKISSESLDSLLPTQLLNLIPEHEHKYIEGYAQKLERWHQEHLDTIRKTEEAEKERERAEKMAKLDELLTEVEGIEYLKEKIAKELKEREEQLNDDGSVQTAT